MSSKNTQIPYALLAPLAFTGLIDAISYMVTAPSIVFYVLANGGSYDAYGIILSSFSFSAFVFKPILGYWCDRTRCFRQPYMMSLSVASLGGLVYFMASSFTSSTTALALILLGRLMGGVGQANSTLGFTYVAEVVDKAALTQASAILSMVRILGMVVAPGMNVFLKELDTTLTVGSWKLSLTPLNSVGLFLALGNLLAMGSIYFFLQEPDLENEELAKQNEELDETGASDPSPKQGFWGSVLSLEIFVPLLSVFTLNANFQLMETGMAPVASDALGWGPVAISAVFGANSVLIFFFVVLTFYLSGKGVTNETLLTCGLVVSAAGYSLMYFLWTKPTTPFLFVMPVVLSTLCFPFLGSPTRSIFTMVVDSKPLLRGRQGTMQAVMSMVVSIAGFATPGIISSFILRTPEEVDLSKDRREFSPFALFAPLLSLTVLAGHLYTQQTRRIIDKEEPVEVPAPDEATKLLEETTYRQWSRKCYQVPVFDAKTTARRRESIALMGIPQVAYEDYQEAETQAKLRQSTGSISILNASAASQKPSRKSFFL